ncbi:MAG: response regulator [Desulfobacteraceae bacterium]|nr:response regulator [Actinomycetota bacterium]MBU4259865.1 response regulator [Pseudomonadota bacterium]MCG2829687.1 response regulator [Desulfobacteraceae bacterium]
MIHVVLVSSDKDFFADLASNMGKNVNLNISRAKSGGNALSMISVNSFELVVTDESLSDMTGLKFVEKLVSINPMINCAAVSSLSSEDFHAATEGLGILMQLPPRPDKIHAENLLQYLNNILNITNRTN